MLFMILRKSKINKQGKVGLLVVLATTIRLLQSLVEYTWAVFLFCRNVLAYWSDDDDVRNVINSSS